MNSKEHVNGRVPRTGCVTVHLGDAGRRPLTRTKKLRSKDSGQAGNPWHNACTYAQMLDCQKIVFEVAFNTQVIGR